MIHPSQAVVVTVTCALAFASLALGGCAITADDPVGKTSEALKAPALPDASLAVPAGNEHAFRYDAAGVQIYECRSTPASTYAWAFVAPRADLSKNGKLVGTHYAGPTWESKDGSKVVGAKVAAFAPDPTAIPWLLLRAVSHAGVGRMDSVTYIQRLSTVGGLAPTSGCDAAHVLVRAEVPYTAAYYFHSPDEIDDGDDGE